MVRTPIIGVRNIFRECFPRVNGSWRNSSDRRSARGGDTVHLQGGAGAGGDVLDGDAGCGFDQGEALGGDIENAEVGDDPVDALLAGEGEGALVDDLGGAVLGGVFHEDDDAACAVDEVHGTAHALDHLAGDHPVGEVAAGGDLHGAEDGGVDVTAADHAEGERGVEEGGARQDGDRFLAGVDQVGVDFVLGGVGAG